MRELPILFSGEMVKAILDGTKTQTRRIIKPHIVDRFVYDPSGRLLGSYIEGKGDGYPTIDDSPYQIGDILYVRETWTRGKIEVGEEPDGRDSEPYISQCPDESDIIYKEDAIRNGICIEDTIWRPSIHMPKEAARIWLEVTDVRVERLQEITAQQAKAEGVGDLFLEDCAYDDKYKDIPWVQEEGLAIHQFARLWDSIYQKQGHGWDVNDWLWVYEFKRLEGQA